MSPKIQFQVGDVVLGREAKGVFARSDQVQVGDLVLVHGYVGKVVELVEGTSASSVEPTSASSVEPLGFIYETSCPGERIAYNAKWLREPEPKRIWILEQ